MLRLLILQDGEGGEILDMKKFILLFVIGLGIVSFFASTGSGHNNSSPNFECNTCHQGEGSAEIKIDGLPKKYVPGKVYKMTLIIESGNQSFGDNAGGFAMEASAGELVVTDNKNTQISEGLLTHTQEGAALRKWTFGWKAPADKKDVDLTIMGVAANGDFSPVGDVIGTEGLTIMPEK